MLIKRKRIFMATPLVGKNKIRPRYGAPLHAAPRDRCTPLPLLAIPLFVTLLMPAM